MKKILLCAIVAAMFTLPTHAGEDEEAVKKAITDAYVEAIHNLRNTENIDLGFHPDFDLLGLRDNELTHYSITDWKVSVQKSAAKYPEGAPLPTEAKFPVVDVTGDAAVAKVELYRADKLIFSDYLLLYRFDEGWKIVSKIYHRH